MASLTIAAAQFAPTDDATANLGVIADAAHDAAAAGARLLVVPEYSAFFERDLGPASVAAAEPEDGPFVTGLAEIAVAESIALVVGTVETSTHDDRFRNTVVAVQPDGAVVVRYRKVHLYDSFGARESDWIEPGDPTQCPVFELDGVRIGIETCYDLRFPEVTRRLAVAGADVVLVPAEWVRGPGKEHHWRTLLTARAIENTLYVVGAGQTPSVGIGASVVVDPSGVTVAGLGSEPGLLTARVSTDEVARVRAVNPSLSLRRYDVVERDDRSGE
ncbi:carbon-nitrogen hydrolase family protein [Curtobacterium sp. Leaf261]|uniref:carbon-nitrogen hydrolase family protein n=1 Tax=Curtobacterium sp. Leaf261 TaxID=1736311 RepID=UPI00070170EB|nr:carbon-nitrogen hydrolase family protein [Curtobacterium sp. Leaf261]KQO62915.1 hydrolase [Curtobacterium sp. Leaf261]